jgi:hypothetical protein
MIRWPVLVSDKNAAHDEANACLLAAAQDLLAVCEEIAGDSRVDLVDSERRIRLYAAIRKAGGVRSWVR